MNQSQALQEAKDKVAKTKKYPNGKLCENWYGFYNFYKSYKNKDILSDAINEAILEYSSLKDKEIDKLGKDYSDLQNRNIELKTKLQQATASSSSGERGDGENYLTGKFSDAYEKHEKEHPSSASRISFFAGIACALPHPSTKEFSREDMDKAVLFGFRQYERNNGHINLQQENEFIQSLTSSHTEVKEGREVEFGKHLSELQSAGSLQFLGDSDNGCVLHGKFCTIEDIYKKFSSKPLNK